jgi:hypothetical protein
LAIAASKAASSALPGANEVEPPVAAVQLAAPELRRSTLRLTREAPPPSEKAPMRLHHARVEHRDADPAAVQLRGVALEVAGAHVAGQGSGDGFEGARGTAGGPVRRHARDITALG